MTNYTNIFNKFMKKFKKPIKDTTYLKNFCTYLKDILKADEVFFEYKFHPSRRWRIDFFIQKNSVKIGLEVEGGIWVDGRHITPKGFLKDMEKYNAMSSMGIILLRTTPKELIPSYKYISDSLLKIIKKTLEANS